MTIEAKINTSVDRVTLSISDDAYKANLEFIVEEYPHCCALSMINFVRFKVVPSGQNAEYYSLYSQNSEESWPKYGKIFFNIYNKNKEQILDLLKKKDKANIENLDEAEYLFEDYGGAGVVTALTYKKVEQPIVDNILNLMVDLFDLPKFNESFRVRSNHGNYPVVQFVSITRKTRTKKLVVNEEDS